MAANSNIKLVGTDFDEIKSNLLTFLRSQNILKDADYTGSVLNMLLDLLAYNTHYNAHYLNMVSNELFLDTAQKRSSVISHSKALGYTPTSYTCATAYVDLYIRGMNYSTAYIPKFTRFITEKDTNDVNHVFVTTKEYSVERDIYNNAIIENVELKQGEPVTYRFVYDSKTNRTGRFTIPSPNIDIDTLEVLVQKSGTDSYSAIYTRVDDALYLDGDSQVYFLQEGFDGNYEIYFGNGVIGKALQNGNIVVMTYLHTEGATANKLSKFSIIEKVAAYDSLVAVTTTPAFLGKEKEDTESIRFIAPRNYSSRSRAVTINDYKTLVMKNASKFPMDAVNIWGGEENKPPIYGKVFMAIKPSGGFELTESQKKLIKETIIRPMSVITVQPEIVDIDYTFINVEVNALIDKSKTASTENDIRYKIMDGVRNKLTSTLNAFDSTLIVPDLLTTVNGLDSCIITNEQKITAQKRIQPTLKTKKNYVVDFDFPIKRDFFGKSVSISPSIQVEDYNTRMVKTAVFLEEVPNVGTSIASIKIANPGLNYTSIPTVTILGDGTGAEAHATVVNGKLTSIIVDNPGVNYTQAIVRISGGGGMLGSATAILQSQFAQLRTYYFTNGVKTILNGNVGTVDYLNGIVSLRNFDIYAVNGVTGELSVNVVPDTSILTSSRNKLLSIDLNDSNAISATIKVK